jgi:hypothetical protein
MSARVPGPFLRDPPPHIAGVRTLTGIISTTNGHVYPDEITFASLKTAIASIGALRKTLHLLPGRWTLTEAIDLPATTNLYLEHGAEVTKGTGGSLRVRGSIEAPAQQVLYGWAAGDVLVDREDVRPEWWGAGQGDDDQDQLAMECANAARP